MKKIGSILIVTLLISCGNRPKSNIPIVTTEILGITSFKAGWTGKADDLCLQVREKGHTNWVILNNVIKKSYQEGYTFTIEVEKTNLDPSKIYGNINSVSYELTKMIKKEFNTTIRLDDIRGSKITRQKTC
jgi:hypothetical protein